jgi:hypothetical protein
MKQKIIGITTFLFLAAVMVFIIYAALTAGVGAIAPGQ